MVEDKWWSRQLNPWEKVELSLLNMVVSKVKLNEKNDKIIWMQQS